MRLDLATECTEFIKSCVLADTIQIYLLWMQCIDDVSSSLAIPHTFM